MKYNKNASEKTVETSINDAPQITRREHIPPIEISSGSVILHSRGRVSAVQNGKQVFGDNKKITGVRVTMTDGTMKADYKDDPAVKGGQIKIWVIPNPPNTPIPPIPDMVLMAPGNDNLQVDFGNSGREFKSDSSWPPTHGRQRHMYSGPNGGIKKVIISKELETLAVIQTDIDNEQEIDRILIWTEMVAST